MLTRIVVSFVVHISTSCIVEIFSEEKNSTNLFHPELTEDCSRQLPNIPNFAEHRSYEVNMSAYWIELLASSTPSNDLLSETRYIHLK